MSTKRCNTISIGTGHTVIGLAINEYGRHAIMFEHLFEAVDPWKGKTDGERVPIVAIAFETTRDALLMKELLCKQLDFIVQSYYVFNERMDYFDESDIG